jgi:uncharacterized protein YlbG (UPF0298 family)
MTTEEKLDLLLEQLLEIKTYVSVLVTLKKVEAKLDHEMRGKPVEEIEQSMSQMLKKHFEFHAKQLAARHPELNNLSDEPPETIH